MNRNTIYDLFLKPLFFRLSPENAHQLSHGLLELGDKIPFFFPTLQALTTYESSRLESKVLGLSFKNPLGMAAGFDKTGELYPFLSRLGFGHVEIGTVTGEAQAGNPQPRLFRYPKVNALINRMGFNNPGAEQMARTLHSQKKSIIRGINAGKTKLVNIEYSAKDYAKSFHLLQKYSDYGVINISSPNTPGLRSLQTRETYKKLINDIKSELGEDFKIPILVKFAPDLTETELIDNLEETVNLNLSGVILTNTTLDKSSLGIDNPEEGGLSGRPLKEKANHFTKIAFQHLKGKLPIIGVGGIESGKDALERIQSGASLVQIYTGYIYKGPFLPYDICKTIDDYLKSNNKTSISEIIGEKV